MTTFGRVVVVFLLTLFQVWCLLLLGFWFCVRLLCFWFWLLVVVVCLLLFKVFGLRVVFGLFYWFVCFWVRLWCNFVDVGDEIVVCFYLLFVLGFGDFAELFVDVCVLFGVFALFVYLWLFDLVRLLCCEFGVSCLFVCLVCYVCLFWFVVLLFLFGLNCCFVNWLWLVV